MADFDDIGHLRRRLARIEWLTAVLAANPKSDEDAKVLSRLKRALRWGRPYPLDDPELPFLSESLLRSVDNNVLNLLDESYHQKLEIEQQLNELKGETAALKAETEELRDTISRLGRDQNQTKNETHAWFAIQSMGIDTADVPLTRFIPLRVYL